MLEVSEVALTMETENRGERRPAVIAGTALLFLIASAYGTEAGVWVAAPYDDLVFRMAPSGSVVQTLSGFYGPQEVAIYYRDESVWITEPNAFRMRRITKDGSIVTEIRGLAAPTRIAVNQNDGSVWVSEFYGGCISRWSLGGTLLARAKGIEEPVAVAVNSNTGEAYTCDWIRKELVKVSPSGSIIWRQPGYRVYSSGAVIDSTGEFYGAGYYYPPDGGDLISGLFLVEPDGMLAWVQHSYGNAWHISVDQVDGSCWFGGGDFLYRYSKNGELELNKTIKNGYIIGLDVVKNDRSLWSVGWVGRYFHISRTGDLLVLGSLDNSEIIYGVGAYAGEVAVTPASLGKIKAFFK